jgi:hypothetical protein
VGKTRLGGRVEQELEFFLGRLDAIISGALKKNAFAALSRASSSLPMPPWNRLRGATSDVDRAATTPPPPPLRGGCAGFTGAGHSD